MMVSAEYNHNNEMTNYRSAGTDKNGEQVTQGQKSG